jgi:predicted esterase
VQRATMMRTEMHFSLAFSAHLTRAVRTFGGMHRPFSTFPKDPPFLILHGTQDKEVSISQSQELVDKVQSVGVPVSFIKVANAPPSAPPKPATS